jgi:alkanesulfonate monooxygenase SsuD/methylene tetrahydromethanopterin reductase-like flavin-dependent oxidoreductase (luciferase family)
VLWGSAAEVAETLRGWIELLEPDEVQLCLNAIPPTHLEDQVERFASLLPL